MMPNILNKDLYARLNNLKIYIVNSISNLIICQ